MAKITIKGDTSGEVDIVAPAVAGTTTYNLSTAGGNILASGDIGTTVQGYNANTALTTDITPTAVSDQANTSTGYFDLPSGTTAQRPVSPSGGMIRHNTTTGEPEWYDSDNGQWFSFRTDPTQYSSDYLIVAGGGGGGGATRGAGGGAGGMLTGTTTLVRGTTYNFTVGSGGASGIYSTTYNYNNKGTQGVNSTALGLTAIGGGFGQGGDNMGVGGSGGSGGGAWAPGYAGGSGTTGQGNAGGASGNSQPYGGGGGGAGEAVKAFNDSTRPAEGGNGLQSSITGTATYYAGGGASSAYGATSGYSGGLGGGGTGSNLTTTVGISPYNGTANTGGGGGASGNGGSGIVILRVLTADYSGTTTGSPTVTTDGSYTVIKFTSSGSYTA